MRKRVGFKTHVKLESRSIPHCSLPKKPHLILFVYSVKSSQNYWQNANSLAKGPSYQTNTIESKVTSVYGQLLAKYVHSVVGRFALQFFNISLIT